MSNQDCEHDGFDTTLPPPVNLAELDHDEPEHEHESEDTSSCFQDEFHFTNVDVRIANSDAHIILSADEADDIIVPSSLLRESRYFDQAFSGNWKADIKKIKSPTSSKVVEVRRWTLKAVWEAEGGNQRAKLYILEGGVIF